MPSKTAICTETVDLRKGAAQGVLADGGPQSRKAVNALLDGLKAGCDG